MKRGGFVKNDTNSNSNLTNYLQRQVVIKSTNVAKNVIDNKKENRKIKVHKEQVGKIHTINSDIKRYGLQVDNTNFDKTNSKRNKYLQQRENILNKNPKLNSNLHHVAKYSTDFPLNKNNMQKKHNQMQMRKKGRYNTLKTNDKAYENISIGKEKNTFRVGNKEDKFSPIQKNSLTSPKVNQKKINQTTMQKNISLEKHKATQRKKSIFHNPLVSKSVGHRNIAQKIVLTPAKAVSAVGTGLKEELNSEIKNSDMEGIKLANDIISPVARKLRFESNKLIARKLGFDRNAYNLQKKEKKIIKTDEKLYRIKKAQRKKIRKTVTTNRGRNVKAGASRAISKGSQIAKKAVMAVANAVKATATSINALVAGGSLILVTLVLIMLCLPVMIIGSSFSSGANLVGDVEYRDDVVYYSQYDQQWQWHPFDIANNGCGPTSMAMAISTLTGFIIDPTDIATFSQEGGHQTENGGSYWSLFPAASEAYGLQCTQISSIYNPLTFESHFENGEIGRASCRERV